MKWVVAAVVLMSAVVVAAFPVFDDSPVAKACSSGPFDPVRDSPIIAKGTFSGWEYVTGSDGRPLEAYVAGASASRPEWVPKQRTVMLYATISGVYKGELPSRIVISTDHFDRYLRAEGSPLFEEWAWPGTAGQCFGIDADPTGQTAVLFLSPSQTRAGEYDLLVSPATSAGAAGGLGEPRPPSVGDSPPVTESSDDWMFVSAIGAGCLLLTLVLVLVGPRRDRRR